MAQASLQSLKNMTPEQRAKFQTEMMKTKLNLDSGQALKVQDINLKYAQKMQPILNSDEGRLSKFKQAKALQEQKDKELQNILSKDQYNQYQAFEDELKSRLREHAKN